MDKENVLIGHIMIDLAAYPIISTLSAEEKANYYDAIMKKYRNEKYENHLINERVKMCFDFSCIDIDKCKAWNEAKNQDHKTNSSKGGKKSGETRKAKKEAREQAEQQGTEDASPFDEIPFVDVEEVEKYPFEEFWNIYDKNVGKRKCQSIWKQISAETKAKIMAHVVEYVKSRDKKHRKDPPHYFEEHTWEDEIITNNPQTESNYGSNNRQSYKEAEFERNARTIVENLQAADRGELAYLSPFNKSGGEHQPF